MPVSIQRGYPKVKMSDSFEQDQHSLMSALRQFFADCPEGLGHLTLRKFAQAWTDPQQRARMEPAETRLSQTVAPIIEKWRKGVDERRRAIRAVFEPWLKAERWLTQHGEQIRSTIERWERAWRETLQPFEQALERMRALGERLAPLVQQVPQLAAEYCRPYQQQIRELHSPNFPLLNPDEVMHFALVGIMVGSPEETRLRRPPPLEEVALACNRIDLAAAVISQERPCLAERAKRAVPEWNPDDLPLDVFFMLYETVLPNFARRLENLTLEEGRRKVKGWMSDQYLTAAIKKNIRRSLERQRNKKQASEVVVGEADLEQAGAAGAQELAVAVVLEQACDAIDIAAVNAAIRQYLGQSKRPEVDRQIVAATKRGQSMRKLSQRIGVPERTLRYRRKRLITACRQSLPPTAPDVS